MRTIELEMAWTIGELSGLPVGTRIATNHNKILTLDEIKIGRYWIEDNTLQPFYQPLVHWLPCIILPPVVDHKADAE
jgi:hypothetical protein